MQTRLVSAIETGTSTLVGYLISVVIGQLFIYPMFGYDVGLMDNAGMTALFVAVSYIRAYGFRRLFSRWLNKVLVQWTKKITRK